MPFYRVVMHGGGILVHNLDESSEYLGEDSIGFYTTRNVRAKTESEAGETAKNLVISEWSEGIYVEANKGDIPQLKIENIAKLDWLTFLFKRRPNRGYTFYSEE